MLLRFKVANHRSLRAENELSLVATELNEGTARATGVRAEGRDVSVVPVAGIFGANASGKSNLLGALAAMREAVLTSLAQWAQGVGVPREPFALDPAARDETTQFEVDILLDDVRHTYGLSSQTNGSRRSGCTPTPMGASRCGSTARPTGIRGT